MNIGIKQILRISFLLALVSLMAIGCDTGDQGNSNLENIFGVDDRIDAPDAAPYRSIGRLDSGCSGTLVGKNLVLTAAHCIVTSPTGEVKTTLNWFRPNLRNNELESPKAWIKRAWVGSNNPDGERLRDFAVIEIDESLGEQFGTLQVNDFNIGANLPFKTSMVGYSMDRANGATAGLHQNCQVREIVENRLFHDCDGASGVSGGPLLNQMVEETFISAITVSEFRQGAPTSVRRDSYSKEYANVAIAAAIFAPVVARLLDTVGRGQDAPTIPGVFLKENPTQRPGGGGGGGPGYSVADVADRTTFTLNRLMFDRAFEDLTYDYQRLEQWARTVRDASLEQLTTEVDRNIQYLKEDVREVASGHDVPGFQQSIFSRWSLLRESLQALRDFPQSSGRANLATKMNELLAPVDASFRLIETSIFLQTP